MTKSPQISLARTLLGLLPLLPSLAAAATEPAVRETLDVRIVTVDVWVTDDRGNRVEGLDIADFEVLEDGKPVSLTHFVELGGDGPRGEEAAESAPAAAAAADHLIVYLDRSRMRPSSYRRALDDLSELLLSDRVAADRVLVLKQDRGLAIVTPLGATREQLADALAQLETESAGGVELDNDVQLALEAIRTTWEQGRDLSGAASDIQSSIPGGAAGPGGFAGGGGSPRDVVSSQGSELGMGPDACRTFFSQIQPILDAWSRDRAQRVAISLGNLSEIVSALAGLPGVKSLLYLGDGLEVQPGAALATYAASLCPGRGTELLNNARQSEMRAAFLQLTRHAASNRVTIYSLETAGLRPARFREASSSQGASEVGGFRAQRSFESALRVGERDGLHLLAHETGGRSVIDRNELGPELRGIVDESRHYYSLAYEPSAAAGEGGRDHRIEVRVRDGSLNARHRRGYLEKDSDTWLTERVLGALSLGIADNPLEVRLGAGEVRAADGGNYRLPLHVMVPVERLAFVGQSEPLLAEIRVAVLARDLQSGDLVRQYRSFRLRGGAGASGLADLPLELELHSGVHLTAVGVRDLASGEASFISTTLQVGDGAATP